MMLYSENELRDRAADSLKGRNPEEFLKQGAESVVNWLNQYPDFWKTFGPYWGVMQQLLEKYQPQFRRVRSWNNGNPPPDFLSHYDTGSDLLNWVASLSYLGRDGDYFAHPDQPHSITLPDESEVLYLPGVGIIEG